MTGITDARPQTTYPGASHRLRLLTFLAAAPMHGTGRGIMSLGTLALTGFVATVVVIVVAITLINKYAN